jgi:DNA repair protein RecO (recombination protein O)
VTAIDGVVVGLVDLGEADRLVRLLTAEEGRIAVVARGARGSRRRYAGAFELGTRVRVVRGRGRGSLAPVAEADVLAAPDVARTEVERIALLGYGCELCAALAPEGAPAPKHHGLLAAWLDVLEGPTRPGVASRAALEAKALTFSGLAPALVVCARCGGPIDDPAVFDPESGGALHGRCGGGRALAASALVELDALRRTPLAGTVARPIPAAPPWLLSDFVRHQLGRALQSRALLEALG